MKLLKHEQDDLMRALHEAGATEQYHLLKKKGWLIIQHPHNEKAQFSFYRKESLSLINGHFEPGLQYTLKYKGQTEEYPTWPEVYIKFCFWLKEQ